MRRAAQALELDAADLLGGLRSRFRLPRDADGTATDLPCRAVARRAAGRRRARRSAGSSTSGRTTASTAGSTNGRRGSASRTGSATTTARLVGARPAEVTTGNTLSINLHLLLASFFRPTGSRTRILVDAPTFPSDRYVVTSQLRLHGLDPATELVVVGPRDGEDLVRHEDVEAAIEAEGDRLAVVLLAGVSYATGQRLDVERLTRAAARRRRRGGVGPGARGGQRAAGAPRLGRRRRGVVHLQVPQRRSGRAGPAVRPRAARHAIRRSRASRAGGATPRTRASGWR